MASFQLRNNIIQSITEKLQQFSFIRKQNYNIPKEKIASNQLTEVCRAIKKEKESRSFTVLKRQQSKYQRDILLFLIIHEKIEGLESRIEDITIISGSYYIEKKRKIIREAKRRCPDQNAINLSNKDLSHAEQSLLRKGSSFIPTPPDINWYDLRRDFDSFVNKLRYRV